MMERATIDGNLFYQAAIPKAVEPLLKDIPLMIFPFLPFRDIEQIFNGANYSSPACSTILPLPVETNAPPHFFIKCVLQL
jgi:hypothetical protein